MRSLGKTGSMQEKLRAIAQMLSKTPRVAVLTGAGISAESGVPTFRDAEAGLWKDFDPDEVATPAAFLKNPAKVWNWYQARRRQIAQVQPNPGHFALTQLEKKLADFTLVTQNIDNLHRLAGSQQVIELHGNIHRNICSLERIVTEAAPNDPQIPPRCSRCGSLLRPDVVWFGEILPLAPLERAFSASRNCDLFFSIGTSSLVEPAASLPWTALEHGARLVEINVEQTSLSPKADFFLQGSSGKILPALLELL